MKKQTFPKIGSQSSIEFCRNWDQGTHVDKLLICRQFETTYKSAINYRSSCRILDLPKLAPPMKSYSWGEHIKRIQQMDDLVGYHMKFPLEVTITIPTLLPIAVVMSADWHLGAIGIDYQSFKTDVPFIQLEEGMHVLVGGDGYQNIIQTSKIGSSHNQTPITVQKGLYVLTLQKLIEKIIAISTGNHNYWTALAEGEDWDAELSRRLKVVYLKHFCKINLVVGKMVYPIIRMHKSSFNSRLNLTHSCKRNQQLYFPDARVVVVEHNHVAAIEQYRYNEKECIAIRTGTYATYDDYALQNGFFGAHVANPTVVFYPNEDKIVGFKDMRDAAVYLRAVRVERGGQMVKSPGS